MLKSRRELGIFGLVLVAAFIIYRLVVAIATEGQSYLGIDGFMNMLLLALEAVGFGLIAFTMLKNELTRLSVVGAILLITRQSIAIMCYERNYSLKTFELIDKGSAEYITAFVMILAPLVLLIHILLKKRKQEMCPKIFFLAPAIYAVCAYMSRSFHMETDLEMIAATVLYTVIGIWVDLLEPCGFDFENEYQY